MRSQGSNPDLIDCKAHRLFTNHFVSKIYRDNPCINFSQRRKWFGVWKCHNFPLSPNLPISEAEHCVLLSWSRRDENGSQPHRNSDKMHLDSVRLQSWPSCVLKISVEKGIYLELLQPWHLGNPGGISRCVFHRKQTNDGTPVGLFSSTLTQSLKYYGLILLIRLIINDLTL